MKFSAPDPAKQAAVEAAAASQGVVDAAAEELVRNDPGMFWGDDGCITLAEATHIVRGRLDLERYQRPRTPVMAS